MRSWIGLAAGGTALLVMATACGAREPATGETMGENDPCGTKSSPKEDFLMLAPNGMARHTNGVLHKYRSLFSRQPNAVRNDQGLLRHEGVHPAGTMGIVIHVTERVDQKTLSLEDRIPDCLEGVPVQVIESVPATRPFPLLEEQVYCRNQWEAVRLPKEIEDLMQTDARRLTIEERERKDRAVDQVAGRSVADLDGRSALCDVL